MRKTYLFNFMSVLFAVILASALYFGVSSNFELLQANITGEQLKVYEGDVLVEAYPDSIKVKANKDFDSVSTIDFLYFYDTEVLSILSVEANKGFSVSHSDSGEGSGTVILAGSGSFKKGEEIFSVSVTGNSLRIVLSDGGVVFDGLPSRENISISQK